MSDRGSFHIGFEIDPATGKPGAEEVVVGSSDLTTHGVVVGMTGSGKTGLAVVLLEEALLSGIPTLVLDPKGDMTNLALVFPDLAPASFRPWVSEAEAQAAGLSADAYAEKQATVWREGLASSGVGPERLQSLKDAADVTIYTPGSTAGAPAPTPRRRSGSSAAAPSTRWPRRAGSGRPTGSPPPASPARTPTPPTSRRGASTRRSSACCRRLTTTSSGTPSRTAWAGSRCGCGARCSAGRSG